MTWVALLVIAGFVLYALGFDYRRAMQIGLHEFQQIRKIVAERRQRHDPIRDALRERSPRVFVTPAFVGINAAMFIGILFGTGSLSSPSTLVDWGGNFGPRTTNGEWWRIVASTFVHGSVLSLTMNLIALWLIGSIVERLAGRGTLLVSYAAGGIFASLASLSTEPAAVHTGAAGAIFGVTGALLASAAWNLPRLTSGEARGEDPEAVLEQRLAAVPFAALRVLAPVFGAFIILNMLFGGVPFGAGLVGLAAGFVCGLGLTRGVSVGLPDPQRVTTTAGIAAVLMFAFAFPLRGIADVRPEIERVLALEGRVSSVYKPALEQYSKGKMRGDTLAEIIDRRIVPEIDAADARLKALRNIPPEHQPIVGDASDYLQLRRKSWQLRAISLRGTNKPMVRTTTAVDVAADAKWRLNAESQYRADMRTIGSVESTERAALVAFNKIKPINVGSNP